MTVAVVLAGFAGGKAMIAQQTPDPYLILMKKAAAHAKAHGDKFTPALSPDDTLLLGPNPSINVKTLHAAGFKVVPWTTNDPEKMKALIALGVDGIISDRPDLLQQVVAEERAAGHKLTGFDVEAHRGGRGLRPETPFRLSRVAWTREPQPSKPTPASPPMESHSSGTTSSSIL